MTVKELRDHLNTLDSSYDDLATVVSDPNSCSILYDTAYSSKSCRITYSDHGDEIDVEDLSEKQKKKFVCYKI